MVKATGYKNGKEIEITAELVDNEVVIEPEEYQKEYERLAEEQPPIAGTFYPAKNTMLSAYNVLNTIFFDDLIEIEAEDIGEMPCEEGIVY